MPSTTIAPTPRPMKTGALDFGPVGCGGCPYGCDGYGGLPYAGCGGIPYWGGGPYCGGGGYPGGCILAVLRRDPPRSPRADGAVQRYTRLVAPSRHRGRAPRPLRARFLAFAFARSRVAARLEGGEELLGRDRDLLDRARERLLVARGGLGGAGHFADVLERGVAHLVFGGRRLEM